MDGMGIDETKDWYHHLKEKIGEMHRTLHRKKIGNFVGMEFIATDHGEFTGRFQMQHASK